MKPSERILELSQTIESWFPPFCDKTYTETQATLVSVVQYLDEQHAMNLELTKRLEVLANVHVQNPRNSTMK
jgi:hypothetical protein